MKRERNLLLVKVHEKKTKQNTKTNKGTGNSKFSRKIFQNTESKSKNLEGERPNSKYTGGQN